MRLPRRRRSGARVVHAALDEPLDDLVADASEELYVVLWLGAEVVGQVWIAGKDATPAALGVQAAFGAQNTALAAALRRRLRDRLDAGGATEAPAAPRVSVVVCTRDRPQALERCLRSLQALQPAAHEVIVVDNAPTTDATRRLCDSLDVTYLLEPVAGASRARNLGIKASAGDLIAFTDDDCVVDPAWLAGCPRAFSDPLVAAVAGYIGPWELATRAQVLFERHGGFERHYRRVTLRGARRIARAGGRGRRRERQPRRAPVGVRRGRAVRGGHGTGHADARSRGQGALLPSAASGGCASSTIPLRSSGTTIAEAPPSCGRCCGTMRWRSWRGTSAWSCTSASSRRSSSHAGGRGISRATSTAGCAGDPPPSRCRSSPAS